MNRIKRISRLLLMRFPLLLIASVIGAYLIFAGLLGNSETFRGSLAYFAIMLLVLAPPFFLWVYRPISKEILEALRAEERFQIIFDSSPNALLSIVDETGTILLVNREACNVFGYSADELIGKKVEVLVPERYRQRHVGYRTDYMRAPTPRPMGKGRDLTGLHKSGKEIPVEIALSPIRIEDKLQILTTITDITVRKNLDAQRLEALKSREELIGVVSHEIRNPLTTVSASLALMQKLLGRPDSRATLEKLLDQGESAIERINRITSDLLDVARFEASGLEIRQEEIEIAPLLRDAVKTYESAAAAKDVTLELSIPRDSGAVFVDRGRITQVLSNLIGNALKFTRKGGKIVVDMEPGAEWVRIQVSDTGVGIAPENLPHIFERYWQVRSNRYNGAGLGLFIAKTIVTSHGGNIWAESEPGHGSKFLFTLPRKRLAAPHAA